MLIRNNASGATHEYSLVELSGDATSYTLVTSTSIATSIAAAEVKNISTAAAGTVRGVIGSVNVTNSAIASGTVVGVRGLLTVSGANTAGQLFASGTQGKLIVTGTMNHADSRFNAVFAQLDATGGTLTAGQLSGIWVDISGITGAGGGQFNAIRITCNAAAVPASLIYAQSDATFFTDLVTPTGGAMTYFAAAGTGANSAGLATGGVAAKVFAVRVDGTTYYLPLFSSNAS